MYFPSDLQQKEYVSGFVGGWRCFLLLPLFVPGMNGFSVKSDTCSV